MLKVHSEDGGHPVLDIAKRHRIIGVALIVVPDERLLPSTEMLRDSHIHEIGDVVRG